MVNRLSEYVESLPKDLTRLLPPLELILGRLSGYVESLPKDLTSLLPPPPSPREAELILMGATADIADLLLGMIPTVGDALADIVVDNVEGDMRRRFSLGERAAFAEQSRFLPSSLATWRVFARARKAG